MSLIHHIELMSPFRKQAIDILKRKKVYDNNYNYEGFIDEVRSFTERKDLNPLKPKDPQNPPRDFQKI